MRVSALNRKRYEYFSRDVLATQQELIRSLQERKNKPCARPFSQGLRVAARIQANKIVRHGHIGFGRVEAADDLLFGADLSTSKNVMSRVCDFRTLRNAGVALIRSLA